jgi:hypothetical protein
MVQIQALCKTEGCMKTASYILRGGLKASRACGEHKSPEMTRVGVSQKMKDLKRERADANADVCSASMRGKSVKRMRTAEEEIESLAARAQSSKCQKKLLQTNIGLLKSALAKDHWAIPRKVKTLHHAEMAIDWF